MGEGLKRAFKAAKETQRDHDAPRIKLFETPEEEIAHLRRWLAYWERQPAFTQRRRDWIVGHVSEVRERLKELTK